jgi:hypothetical protein
MGTENQTLPRQFVAKTETTAAFTHRTHKINIKFQEYPG